MSDVVTKLSNLINPQVMADVVQAKLESVIAVMPYAKIDTTLEGQAGDTITVPKFEYIGDAVDVAEGEEIPTRALECKGTPYAIKKVGIGGSLTDEAVLSGYGNPVGELSNQMGNSIASKNDADCMEELYKAKTSVTASTIISYDSVVNGIDAFEEEENSEKVIFVHPKQVTQLRLDPTFISKEKYNNEVVATGEIGMIGNAHVKPSKKVKLVEGYYINPIVKLTSNTTDDESPALTIFVKRDTNIETERVVKKRCTEITGDKLYVAALTNESKVVLLKTLAVASV